jgi:hypothetical protein
MPEATIFGRTLSTAGCTAEQLERSIALCDELDKLVGSGTAKALLRAEYGLDSRKGLTEERAEAYLGRLRERIAEARAIERVATKKAGPYRITRADDRRGHKYDVWAPNGVKMAGPLPGITTALNVLDKPGLLPWMANITGDAFKAEIRRVLIDEPMVDVGAVRAALLPLLNVDGFKLANQRKKEAGARGSDGHTVAELVQKRVVSGASIDDTALSLILNSQPALAAPDVYLCALAFREWLLRVKPKILATEAMVSCLHCKCAATLDLHCIIDHPKYGGEWILDIKHSKGTYPTHALQTAFQAHALMQMKRGLQERHCAVYRRLRIGALWISPNAENGCEVVEFDNSQALLDAVQRTIALYHWERTNSWRKKMASFPRNEAEVAETVAMVAERRAAVTGAA